MPTRPAVAWQTTTRTRHKQGATEVLERVKRCAKGEEEMTQTEIAAARLYLGKVLPDLKAVEIQADTRHASIHGWSATQLLDVIEGEATRPPVAIESGGSDMEAHAPSPEKISPELSLTHPEKNKDHRPIQTREQLLKRLPDPPPGYKYGERSQNGQSLALIKIEESDTCDGSDS